MDCAWNHPAGTVKAYLFTIARNLYHDSLHRARRLATLDERIQDKQPDPHKPARCQT